MGDALPLPCFICGMPGALQSCEDAAAAPDTAYWAMCRASNSTLAVDPRCCASVLSDALHMHARQVKGDQSQNSTRNLSSPCQSQKSQHSSNTSCLQAYTLSCWCCSVDV